MRGAFLPQHFHGGAAWQGEGSGGDAQGDPRAGGRNLALAKASAVADKLEGQRLGQAAALVRAGIAETLSYMAYPREHWRSLRTNNPLERVMRELRSRTRVVGNFPDGESALMLVAARLRYMAAGRWGTRRYLDMSRLNEVSELVATAG